MEPTPDHARIFEDHRRLLFSIAYRMLGSVTEAEDVVQDGFLRWQGVELAEIDSPKAYLSSIVTRLSLDHLRSARHRRETYVGPWLPEPLVSEEMPDVSEMAEMSDSLSMAFLVMLEKLNPVERAVFLLHEVFGYPHEEVARMVDRSEGNCRQILRRAHSHIADERVRFEASRAERDRLTQVFIHAAATGDSEALLSVLAEDATLWSDGGGKKRSALKPIYGRVKVARWLLGVLRKDGAEMQSRGAVVNGQPGLVSYLNDEIDNVLTLDIWEGRVQGVRIVRNPEKLRHIRL